MATSVGADIKSACSKCKQNTWHVIVAKVGIRIAKVQCKSCGAQHRYKDPAGVTSSPRASGQRKAAAKKAAPLPAGPTVEPNLNFPTKAYSVRAMFKVGDRVNHPKFGTGVVEIIPDAGKMRVCFATGRRVLAMAKKEAALTRPQNRTFDT